jgi:hypothetical protein
MRDCGPLVASAQGLSRRHERNQAVPHVLLDGGRRGALIRSSPPPADIKRVPAAPKIGLVVVVLPTARWHRFMVLQPIARQHDFSLVSLVGEVETAQVVENWEGA